VTIFDLLFLVGAGSLVVVLLRIVYQLLRRRNVAVLALCRRTAAVVVTYVMVIIVTSIVTPRRIVPVGTEQCFDDWCITVAGAAHRGGGAADTLVVTLRLSSQARGIAQGERDVRVYLVDEAGRRYQPIPTPDMTPLSARIPPLGALTTTRRFIMDASAPHPMLVVAHDPFPHCCIIADGESLFHRRTVVPLN
jgi:hypothetical protein